MEENRQKSALKVRLSGHDVMKIVMRIQSMVRDGTLGKDYTIAPREKNRRLRRDYNIDDSKIKQIMLDLRSEDFIKAERSDNPVHPEDIVYIFKKRVALMPKWRENADYQQVVLYIKITWPIDGMMMFIISFHEDNI